MKDKNTVYGINAVENILLRKANIVREVFIDKKSLKNNKIQNISNLAKQNNIKVHSVENLEKTFNFYQNENHQGVAANIESNNIYGDSDLKHLVPDMNLVLMLDSVTDPQNLGACLRSAEVFGVDAVIIPKDKSAQISPVVRKVACGAAELINIVVVTNIARTIELLQENGFWAVGAAGEATESIEKFDFPDKSLIVMGSEGDGLRDLTRKKCDFLVKIPMFGSVESLNVSVATGVFLYAVKTHKKKKST